jgi:uncharacterized protein YjcR
MIKKGPALREMERGRNPKINKNIRNEKGGTSRNKKEEESSNRQKVDIDEVKGREEQGEASQLQVVHIRSP